MAKFHFGIHINAGGDPIGYHRSASAEDSAQSFAEMVKKIEAFLKKVAPEFEQ